ncbi:MAG: glycosyltransferase family 2 protein, partial [Janthinobacterium lividum]
MRIAALTMVWNEPFFLPLWLRHYGRHLGPQNCFVLDHGSDDGSTEHLGGACRVLLPRTPLDEEKRARAVSSMAAS